MSELTKPTVAELLASLPAAAFTANLKYATKMSFTQRCGALACILNGVSPKVIAEAFGVHRATISAMRNRHSPHYRAERREMDQLGAEEFVAKYLTTDIAARITKTINDSEALARAVLNDHDYRENHTTTAASPNPNATKYAGEHRFFSNLLRAHVTGIVAWEEVVAPDPIQERTGKPGWYYHLSANDQEDYPGYKGIGGGDASLFTSKQAYDFMLTEMVAEV